MRKVLEHGRDFGDESRDLAVLQIVISVLHMISAEDLDFSQIVFTFPLKEVYFLEELLLVKFELPHFRLLLNINCLRQPFLDV